MYHGYQAIQLSYSIKGNKEHIQYPCASMICCMQYYTRNSEPYPVWINGHTIKWPSYMECNHIDIIRI